MTLVNAKLTPAASHADWKAFRFESGNFLLHVPTAHVLAGSEAIVAALEQQTLSPEAAQQLRDLEGHLPKPPEREYQAPNIKSIALNVIQGCNLRCTYCYAGDGDYGKNSKMDVELAKQIVDSFAQDQKHLHVVFFGGEPLMNFSLIQAVVEHGAHHPSCKFSYSLTSNGTLINPTILEFMHKHHIKMTISYDGHGIHAKTRLNMDKTTNSESLIERKLKHFNEQLQAVREFGLRGTVRRVDIPLLEQAILSTLTSQNFSWTYVRHASAEERQKFTSEDAEAVGEILRRVVDRLLAEKSYDQLLRLGNLKAHIMKIHRGAIQQGFCGAGTDYLSVSTSGQYYLCHRFTEDDSERVGSFEQGLDQARLAKFAEHRMVHHAPCNTCWMREWCGGGCYHEHKMANGTAFTPDPLFCMLREQEMTQAMRVYTHIMAEAPELLENKVGTRK